MDTVTLLSGYIDPNSPIYAVYSTKLPAFYPNGIDPGPQGLSDEGPPVYTNGIVYALESATANTNVIAKTTGTAGTSINAGTILNSQLGVTSESGQNRVSAVTTLTTNVSGQTLNIDFSVSQVYEILFQSGSQWNMTLNASAPGILVGSVVYMLLYNSSGNTLTITFGGNIREQTASTTMTNGTTLIVTFVCDGTSFFEVCRRSITT